MANQSQKFFNQPSQLNGRSQHEQVKILSNWIYINIQTFVSFVITETLQKLLADVWFSCLVVVLIKSDAWTSLTSSQIN